MEQAFLIAQGLGLVAMALGLCAWQIKNPKLIMGLLGASDSLWAAQYFLLGATVGGFMLIGTSIRNTASGFVNQKVMRILIAVFLTYAVVMTAFTYSAPKDILPLIGTVIFSLGLLNNEQRALIARASILGNCCWLSYAFLSHSYLAGTYAIMMGASALIGMARYEKWELGNSIRSFPRSLYRALFLNFRTFP